MDIKDSGNGFHVLCISSNPKGRETFLMGKPWIHLKGCPTYIILAPFLESNPLVFYS